MSLFKGKDTNFNESDDIEHLYYSINRKVIADSKENVIINKIDKAKLKAELINLNVNDIEKTFKQYLNAFKKDYKYLKKFNNINVLKCIDFIDKEDENQLIILCGHSRGAACANLLGVLLNEYIDPSRVYSYTYACPATIRSGSFSAADQNIFNFINPADLIPMTPFAQWGFKRAGTDIILSGYDSEAASDAGRYAGIMASLAPTISSYYNDRHALDRAGLSDSGITSFEIMLYICTALIDLTETVSKGSSDTMDHKNISDLEKIISEDSDLYALLDIYKELAADNYQKGIDLLSQHLPTTYLQLLGVAF